MDDHQFDEVTRAMASGTSRRRVLGIIAGGLAVAFGGAGQAARAGFSGSCKDECMEIPPGKARGQCLASCAGGGGGGGTCIETYATCNPHGKNRCCDGGCSQHGDCTDSNPDAFCC